MIRELMETHGKALGLGEVFECHLDPDTQTRVNACGPVEVGKFVACWAYAAPEIRRANRSGRFIGLVHDDGVALYAVP